MAGLLLLAACSGSSSPVASSPAATSVRAARPADVDAEPTNLTESQKKRDAASAARVKALLDVYENGRPVLSPDGTKVLFQSNRASTGLYLVDVGRPGAEPKALSGLPEGAVGPFVFTRDGASLLVRTDSGGAESFHIHRFALDGSKTVDLTPNDPLWRDTPLLPRDKPDLMVYGARKHSDLVSMLMVQNLSGGEPRVAYRDSAAAVALDVSADGRRALWVREVPRGGHELSEIDLSTGKARLLSPLDGKAARITTAAFSADGTRVYIGTDSGTEVHSLFAIDRESLKTVAEYRQEAPATAAVGVVVASPRGDTVAIGVDAGDHSTVRVLDARTLTAKVDVKMPLGVASIGLSTEVRFPLGSGTFAPDGSRFVLGFSNPNTPGDIFLVDARTGAATPVRRDLPSTAEGIEPLTASIESVTSFDGLAVPINLFVPKGSDPKKRYPTIIDLHGGPDANTPFAWDAFRRVFTSFGFAVVEANIRGSTGFGRAFELADDREKRLDALRDVESINQWARRQTWCDPDRLVVAGGSFGGYLVLMALTRQPKLWNAGIDLAGVTDLTTFLGPGMSTRYFKEFGDPKKDAQLLAELSPLRDAGKIAAPLFVFQGQNDARVPRSQADAMVRALRSRNIPVEYMVASNEGHGITHAENRVEYLTRAIRFLQDELRLTP
ncbi:MAG TPA: prolyl oligopeptidase family serine peptidase [Labilithrix sp.]|nr:prolyl oligopeptidase family serine peptidase [Labilithrix sp.]